MGALDARIHVRDRPWIGRRGHPIPHRGRPERARQRGLCGRCVLVRQATRPRSHVSTRSTQRPSSTTLVAACRSWVATGCSGVLRRSEVWAIDTATGEVAERLPVPESIEVISLEVSGNDVFVGMRHPGHVGAVLHLDRTTGEVAGRDRGRHPCRAWHSPSIRCGLPTRGATRSCGSDRLARRDRCSTNLSVGPCPVLLKPDREHWPRAVGRSRAPMILHSVSGWSKRHNSAPSRYCRARCSRSISSSSTPSRSVAIAFHSATVAGVRARRRCRRATGRRPGACRRRRAAGALRRGTGAGPSAPVGVEQAAALVVAHRRGGDIGAAGELADGHHVFPRRVLDLNPGSTVKVEA